MKLSLVITFLVLFCLQNQQTKAQAYIYHPFSTDTVKWVYYNTSYSNMGISNVVIGCYSSYIQAGDTSFTAFPGKVYKKIYSGSGVITNDMSLHGYIREQNKIIFSLTYDLSAEYELYNFTKRSIGDTLKFYNFSDVINPNKAKIIAFDSIQTVSGLDYYKVYKLEPINYDWGESCNYVERNYLGEGIGCFPDLRYRCLGNLGCPCESNSFFNTLIINRDTIIKNLFFDCKLTGIKEKENTVENNIKVYPNPTDAVLNINACSELLGEEKSYLLYDMLGNKLMEKTDRKCSVDLNTKQLKNGNYIWLITTEKKSYTGKIIINH